MRSCRLRRTCACIIVLLATGPLLVADANAQRRRRFGPRAQAPTSGGGRTMQLTYPASHKGEQVDDYHGTQVPDPYRWLEDLDSKQTKAWVEAQNKVTFGWLSQVSG